MLRLEQDPLLYLEGQDANSCHHHHQNKDLMLLLLKILLGLIGAILLYLSANWMFSPQKIMRQHDLESSSATGYNFIRGDIGGILLAGTIFIGLFLYHGREYWLYPGVIIISTVILGRVIGLIIDGHSKKGIQAIIVEVIIISLMFGIDYLS